MTRAQGRPLALVTLPDVAEPGDTGRRLRSRSTIVGLAEHFELDVLVTRDPAEQTGCGVPNLPAVRRVLLVDAPAPPKPRVLLEAARTGMPIELRNQSWPPVLRRLREWPLERDYDLVWFGAVSHHVGLAAVVCGRRTVVDYDDLQTAKWTRHLAAADRRARTLPDRLRRSIELAAWARAERSISAAADAVAISDDGDLVECESLGIERPAVVPNSYPDPGLRPFSLAEPYYVAYVGNFHYEPNRRAVEELRSRIMPLLRKELPDIVLRLIGPGSIELAGDDEAVIGRGLVPAVAPELEGCAATLLPIRTGGGTRIKAMEAFALGVPVVGTAFALAGLGVHDGEHVRLADSPQQFVSATLELVRDAVRRTRMQQAARAFYEQHLSPESSTAAIADLLRRVGVAAA